VPSIGFARIRRTGRDGWAEEVVAGAALDWEEFAAKCERLLVLWII
jgi:hypothetical protein